MKADKIQTAGLEDRSRARGRLLILIGVLLLCCIVSWVMNNINSLEKVYTHLFYIPVILAGTWFRKKAFILSILLGSIHIFMEDIMIRQFSYVPLVRVSGMFLVTLVVVLLAEKNEKLQAQIRNRLSDFQETNNAVGDIMGRCDVEGAIHYITPSIEKVLGFAQRDVLGRKFIEFVFDGDREMISKEIHQALESSEELRGEFRAVSKNGKIIWLEMVMNPIRIDKICTGAVFLCYDVTERKLYDNKIMAKIYRDELTGIYNRRYMDEALERQTRESAAGFTLMMLDIDFFKQVNDSYGHQEGDRVLIRIAQLIQQSVRHTDILARYGGEEFTVSLSSSDIFTAWEIAERIRRTVEGADFSMTRQVTISIGITQYMIGDTKSTLYQQADEALYLAKKRGRNRVAIHSRFGFSMEDFCEIPWNSEWNSGEIDIDRQHRQLLQTLNHMVKIQWNHFPFEQLNSELYLLKKDLTEHFIFEEYLLQECGYPDLKNHMEMHNGIVHNMEKVLEIGSKNLAMDRLLLFQFLLDIILGHFQYEDRKFFGYLKPLVRRSEMHDE